MKLLHSLIFTFPHPAIYDEEEKYKDLVTSVNLLS